MEKITKRLLTVVEVAENILNIKPERVYTLIREGLLPSVRLGRQVRIDSIALEEWISRGGKAFPEGWRKTY